MILNLKITAHEKLKLPQFNFVVITAFLLISKFIKEHIFLLHIIKEPPLTDYLFISY